MKTKKTKIKWATVNFTYTPPTEAETALSKVKEQLDIVEKTAIFLAGVSIRADDYRVGVRQMTSNMWELFQEKKERYRALQVEVDEAKKKTKTK